MKNTVEILKILLSVTTLEKYYLECRKFEWHILKRYTENST